MSSTLATPAERDALGAAELEGIGEAWALTLSGSAASPWQQAALTFIGRKVNGLQRPCGWWRFKAVVAASGKCVCGVWLKILNLFYYIATDFLRIYNAALHMVSRC